MALSISGDRIQINARELGLKLISPPMRDGTTFLVETTSNPADRLYEKLSVNELRGLLGAMLPQGLDLQIDSPESRTPGLRHVFFQNLTNGREIHIAVHIGYYKEWPHKTNLNYVADELRSVVDRQLPNCRSTYLDKGDIGVTLFCEVHLEPTDDCYEAYVSTDKALCLLLKNVISNTDRQSASKVETNAPHPDAGFRWWLRYVLVPIISGGTGAAIIGWLILHL